MATTDRVTVTLPAEVVQEIDRREKNRSRFMLEAVKRELLRRRREELRRSLRTPHPESVRLAESGIGEWARGLPREKTENLVDLKGGTAVRWIPGRGWEQTSR